MWRLSLNALSFSEFWYRGGPITWGDVVHEAQKRLPGANIIVLLEGRSEEVDPNTVVLDPWWWRVKRMSGKKPEMEHLEHFFNKNLEGLLQQ